MNKCLSVAYMNENWNNKLIQSVIEAGRTISYVETTTPTQADKFHIAIKESDNKTFTHEFEQIVRFAIAKLKLKRVKIAFDTTEDLTWIKSGFDLRPSAYKHQLLSWQYLNVGIIEPCFIPLMSIPYRQIDDLDSLVIDLLNYIKTLLITVDLILFDRGFYHAHLIDYLNGNKRGYSWPYLMLVPEKEAQKDYIQQTRDANLMFASYKHTFNYKKDKSSWHPYTIIMIKIVDEKVAWCYATNKKPSLKLCIEYPKRWNIETGFRVHDEAKIKSKSNYLKIRFFYHLLGMLLIVLWRLQNIIAYLVFKRYLKRIELFYADKLGVKHPP
jgi:hypothetical protein